MKINMPRLGSKLGYPSYPESAIFSPVLQLSENRRQGHHDTVFMAQLIHAWQPRNILDLGCYTGMLGAFVEDLLRDCGSDHASHSSWTLVDNFDFLRDLRNGLNDPAHKCFGLNELLKPVWQEAMTAKHYMTLPPETPEQLLEFISAIVKAHAGVMPEIGSINTGISQVTGKYDFVIYDLYGANYTFETAKHVVNNLVLDQGLIVFDDMKPRWPQQMAMFVNIVNTLPVIPVAFNSAKVAMIKTTREFKEALLREKMAPRLNVSPSEQFYWWTTYTNEVFGQIISLQDHV